ncbi:MAG TPA: cytochrome o ubiquinol oxidase subunit III [Candidatus Saccharimonadales bacterium]|nr:cytochrome o ubiquinol oxidase subunit III [Candidatus Saccharimonadales bacterium]
MSEPNEVVLERLVAQDAPHNTAKTTFGFWVYLMTDCVLFASLFAVYAVLHRNTFGGPGGQQLFDLPYVLGETMLLLTSSFTCGLAMLAAQRRNRTQVLFWLGITALLGLSFLAMELHEFRALVLDGNSWRRSGFLSGYFTLVGTHGAHITVGLIWMVVMMLFVLKKGLTPNISKRLMLLSLFWHFLDVVWIFIFTIVYLFGANSL